MAVDYVRVYEFDPFASINELNSESLKFYPNPASEHLIFENPTFDEVTVFSLDGKLIAEKQLIANSINISNLDSGIYLISVNGKNNEKITKRFVKN